MIFVKEMKDLKIYKKPFYLPTDDTDKLKKSAIFLLTPNYESSKNVLSYQYLINRNNCFRSFYMEKNINYFISSKSINSTQESYRYALEEAALSSEDRNDLSKDDFGIPELRKYPLIDKDHTIMAIRFFNKVDPKYEKELASNIKKAIKKYDIDISIGKGNKLSNYITEEAYIPLDESDFVSIVNQDGVIDTEYYGLISDVKAISKFIDKDFIDSLFKDISLPIESDRIKLKVNVVSQSAKDNYSIDILSYDGKKDIYCINLNVLSYSDFNSLSNMNEAQYISYLRFLLTKSFIAILNPKCNSDLVTAYAMILNNYTYTKNKNMEYIISVLSSLSNDEINEIIINNDTFKVVSLAQQNNLSVSLESCSEMELIEESNKDKMDSNYLTYLRHHVMYAARKNKYKANAIVNNIEKSTKDLVADSLPKAGELPSTSSVDSNSDEEEKKETVSELYYMLDTMDESSYFKHGDNYMFFNEDAKYDPKLKRLLFNDRIKQNKEMLAIYKKVKEDNPNIKYTFINLDQYKLKNLFIDLSYYNETFFRNNSIYKLDQAVDLYLELMDRLLDDSRLKGYTKKTIFIPILDWDKASDAGTALWYYKRSINPISVIHRMMTRNPDKLKSVFGNRDVLFLSSNRYFKLNFSNVENFKSLAIKFKMFIEKILKGEEFSIEDSDDSPNIESPEAIKTNIMDKLEDSQKIKLGKSNPNKDEEESDIDKDVKKKELEKQIEKVANRNTSTDDAIEDLENSEESDNIKKLIMDLSIAEEESKAVSNARAARIMQLQTDMEDKYIKGVKIKDLLNKDVNIDNEDPIPSTDIPVSTPFKEEWSDLKFMNFDKGYNVDKDIVNTICSLSKKQYPLAVRDIQVTDASTSEDYIDLYTVKFEDFKGKRFTVQFDVPKFKNNKYLVLRGNKKYIQNQLFNIPVIKTEENVCQIISNYQKIFNYINGSVSGKMLPYADRIIKAYRKYSGTHIKFLLGENSTICSMFDLPVDYVDLASTFNSIETPSCIYYFNQEEIRNKYVDLLKLSNGLPYAYDKKNKSIKYWTNTQGPISKVIGSELLEADTDFADLYISIHPSVRYAYSECSVLDSRIPLVIVCAHSVGLTQVLTRAKIEYKLIDKLTKENKSIDNDYIKFSDGYLMYPITYESSMLLNGLKRCATEEHSLSEINSKSMYIEFLDNFGGRIKSDGLDNFYECFVDPITYEVATHYKLPNDYIGMLILVNKLLCDNKYIRHVDVSSKRLRRGELIASKVYKALVNDAYCSYANQVRHNRTAAQFSLKRSAVIDKFMEDNTSSDLSIVNGLNDIESINSVTSKGENGLNSDRGYTVDKRSYDKSMLNLIGMSTGFAGNIGITRQATIDMNIDTERGYVKTIDNDTSKLNTQKTLTATEALTPFGTTRDDPFRTAMTFIQTAKHAVRTDKADPLLVTNGADEAIPYITSDIFAFKSKEDGTIIEYVENKYAIIEYKSGKKDFIKLEPTIEKNSDGGYYNAINLIPAKAIKAGTKFKSGEIIAYDEKSFSKNLGESDNPAYNIGRLVKLAILNSDESFEDSAIVTEKLCQELATNIIMKKERVLDKNTNIYNMVKVGQEVEEGEVLFQYQQAFEDEDINVLMKNLKGDSEEISNLSRNFVKSPVTGKVSGIKIYRTCDVDTMSESMANLVKKYEAPINSLKKKLNGYNISSAELDSTDKMNLTGKMKNKPDCVLIEIYIEFKDTLSIGDKIVYWSANKGVVKNIIPKGEEPYTELRPNEEVSAYAGIASINKRMIMSSTVIGSLNKLMIELTRSCRDICGMPYKEDEI